MAFQVGNAAYPSASEIRDQILRDLDYYGRQHGIVFNIRPGSEHYLTATAIANRVVVAIANNRISNDQRNPLTATGTALRDLARVYGIVERPATASSGPATVKVGGGATVTIPAGWQGTAPNGKKYRTTTEVLAAVNGSSVTFLSVDAGADTELVPGTQITWDSAAVASLLNPATVASPGVVGGADTDDDEDIRRRLVDRLAAQAVGGNAASIKGWAEEVSPSISLAVVYQGIRGPGSVDVAVLRDAGDRTVVGTTVDLARANVAAELPGGVISVNCTTVNPQLLDIVVEAELPLPRSAGGTGGGWRDAEPWPAELTKVTAIFGATHTVDSTAAPIVGQSIGLWDYSDPDEPVMRERSIATVGGSAGAWTVTFAGGGTGFVGVGDYVSAGATNLPAYAADLYAQFLLLGPGEKTDNVDLLPRSARYPSPEATSPFALTNKQIGEVLAKYDEMLDLRYLATYESGTTTTRTTPGLPATTASAPKILVCRRLAFVRKP
jgi:uncharacterized phage protein gp47/JayE